MKEYADLFDGRRNAHRVFRTRKGADRFNPFRHIPWDYKETKDLEAGPRQNESKTSPQSGTLLISL